MKFYTLILYVACFLIANTAQLQAALIVEIYDEPKLALTQPYVDENDRRGKLGKSTSQLRVVNFWALWCAPCVAELASLNALDKMFDDRDLDVITIATGKNAPEDVRAMFEQLDAENLTEFFDPNSRLAAQAGVVSIPYTILLNATGAEIGRVIGAADWDDPEMTSQLRSIIDKFEANSN